MVSHNYKVTLWFLGITDGYFCFWIFTMLCGLWESLQPFQLCSPVVFIWYSVPLEMLWLGQNVVIGVQYCVCSWEIDLLSATLPGFQVC